MHGVFIVFNGRVILGTRARKTHTKSFDAFASINYPNIADVRDGRLIRYITPQCLSEPRFYDRLDPSVGLLKLSPGMRPELLAWMLREYHALVVESFGVGGLPHAGGMHEMVSAAVAAGKAVVMTTQVQNEGSDPGRLRHGPPPGRGRRRAGGLRHDHRVRLAKLMWLLPLVRAGGDLRQLFYTPVSLDILASALN